MIVVIIKQVIPNVQPVLLVLRVHTKQLHVPLVVIEPVLPVLPVLRVNT